MLKLILLYSDFNLNTHISKSYLWLIFYHLCKELFIKDVHSQDRRVLSNADKARDGFFR